MSMDETPLQVLSEPSRLATGKSYMWIVRGGSTETQIVYYNYQKTRKSLSFDSSTFNHSYYDVWTCGCAS